MNNLTPTVRAGDLVQVIGEKDQSFIIRVNPQDALQTHLGVLQHSDLIGAEWGSSVTSHLGKQFVVLQPALDDLLRSLSRNTQIIYPKDLGYILVSLGIGPGSRVIEIGTGSGALTAALAYYVGREGQVYSYDINEKHQQVARANLDRLGLANQVTFHIHNPAQGFFETGVGAAFIDVPDPQEFIPSLRSALNPGGSVGALLPTTNQVSELITLLKRYGYSFLEISEILHRYYKPTATRLRPVDRMIAHTGYLIFARLTALPSAQKM